MSRNKWNNAAFMALEGPTPFPTNTREDPHTHTGMSAMLYAWDEAKQATEAKKKENKLARQHVGVRAFSWEIGKEQGQ